MKKFLGIGGVLIALLIVGGMIFTWYIGINNEIIGLDETVNQSWSQVQNAYQRRADLIPNLVETVKGFAKQEQEVLVQVTEARSKMGGTVTVGSDVLNDPAKLQQFQQMQSGLGAALQRLMVVVEKYPELKSDQNFRDLQVQLEGTENRITVERQRFNETVQAYNTRVRQFPGSLVAGFKGYQEKAYFQAVEGAATAPEVKF